MTTIVAIEGTAWYSKAIEWFTWSPYSHVAIIVNGTAYEATTPKVRSMPENEFWLRYKDEDCVLLQFKQPLSLEQENALSLELRKHVGDAYCKTSLFRFVFRDNPDRPREDWVCSKYIFDCIARAVLLLQERIPSFKIAPVHIVMSPLLEVKQTLNKPKTVKILKSPHES